MAVRRPAAVLSPRAGPRTYPDGRGRMQPGVVGGSPQESIGFVPYANMWIAKMCEPTALTVVV